MMSQLHFPKMCKWNGSCTLWQHYEQDIIVHGSVCKSCSGTCSSESSAWTTEVKMRKILEWYDHECPMRTTFHATLSNARRLFRTLPSKIHTLCNQGHCLVRQFFGHKPSERNNFSIAFPSSWHRWQSHRKDLGTRTEELIKKNMGTSASMLPTNFCIAGKARGKICGLIERNLKVMLIHSATQS